MRSVLPPDAKVVPAEAKKVFTGVIFDVYQWQQKMFDGTEETFEMLKRPDTVVIVAVKDGKIVILDEEQPGRKPFSGLPGGRHDKKGESELVAAKRELLEETGMQFKTWRLIHVEQPLVKLDWMIYVFLAIDFESAGDIKLDAGERIALRLVTYDELLVLCNDSSMRSTCEATLLTSVGSLENLLALPEYQ